MELPEAGNNPAVGLGKHEEVNRVLNIEVIKAKQGDTGWS